MADTLRIKRRSAAGAAGAPVTLAASEIAYNEKDDILYYGKGDSGGLATSIIPIAGPGFSGGGGGSSAVSIADTAPAGTAGQMWWESDTGVLWLYYNDGSSSQWVQAAGATGGVTISDGPPAGTHGSFWWESDTGILWINYNDGTSSQWVQASGVTGSDRVLRAGDTMTGPLTIDTTGGYCLSITNPYPWIGFGFGTGPTEGAGFWFYKGVIDAPGTMRWGIAVTDTALGMERYNDSGVYLDNPLNINRATGATTLSGDLVVEKNTGFSNIISKGPSSGGTQPGARFEVQAGGSATLIMANYSSIYGGAFDNRGTLWSASGTLVLGVSVIALSTIDAQSTIAALGKITTTAKENRFGVAGGTVGTGAVTTADANIKLYENSSVNWCGLGTDGGGSFWLRTGLSGSPSPALMIQPDKYVRITGPLSIEGNGYGILQAASAGSIQISVAPGGLAITTRPATDIAYWPLYAQSYNTSHLGGVLCSTTGTQFQTTSDARLKEDLKSFDAGHIIDGIEVYDFAWKETGTRAYGVIAQQAKDVYDTPTYHDEKSDRWFVDYSKYVPVLLQELKSLRARVAELEAKANGV